MYQYKDHLDNVRLSYTDGNNDGTITQDEIIEESNFYPFGLEHKGYNNTITGREHPYGFNGIELTENLGLNLYEMDVRKYDPAIARWTGIDPVTHHSLSPYNAFDNNPVFFADPSGANSEDFINDLWNQSGEGSTTWTNNNDGTFSDGNGNTAEGGQCTDCSKCPETCGNTAHSNAGRRVTHPYAGYALPRGGYNAAMRGGNPWEPTEEDVKSADAAVGQAVLFISGEWAAVKVFQGGAWVVRFVRAKNIAKGVNVAQGAVKFSDEAAAAFKRLGNLTAFARIKNGVAHINIGFLKNFKPGDIKLVEEAFKANGASSMRVSSGISVDKVIVNALNKRIQSGQGFMGYNIQSGWRAWITGNRYILTKSLK